MEQRSAIPWCDRRRTYCASGCSIREKSSNSGACDWEAKMAAAAQHLRVEVQPEARPRPQEQQPRPQQQFVRNPQQQQQHPRGRFPNGGRKGPGAPVKSGDASRASQPAPAPVTVAAPAATAEAVPAIEAVAVLPASQPDMFSAPAPVAAAAEPVAVAVEAPAASGMAQSPSGND